MARRFSQQIRNLSPALLCAALLGAATSLHAASFEELFPLTSKFGCSAEQLRAMRPKAVRSISRLLPRSKQDDAGSFEMIERIASTAFCTYVFRENALRALMMSEPVVPSLPRSLVPESLLQRLAVGFRYESSENIARANEVIDHFPVSADLWVDDKSGLHAYFVSTSQETTLIVFDSAKLSGESFFVGADKIPELKAGAESIRSLTNAKTKTAPSVVDLPRERELPKPAAHSSSKLESNLPVPSGTEAAMEASTPLGTATPSTSAEQRSESQPRIKSTTIVLGLLALGVSLLLVARRRR